MDWQKEYLEFRLAERKRKDERRMLWMGKFAFPDVNTLSTKIMYVPDGAYEWNFPVTEEISITEWKEVPEYLTSMPKIDKVTLKKWGYKGKRRRCALAFAYYKPHDVLVVRESSFLHETAVGLGSA